jgi:hypothetical protein
VDPTPSRLAARKPLVAMTGTTPGDGTVMVICPLFPRVGMPGAGRCPVLNWNSSEPAVLDWPGPPAAATRCQPTGVGGAPSEGGIPPPGLGGPVGTHIE